MVNKVISSIKKILFGFGGLFCFETKGLPCSLADLRLVIALAGLLNLCASTSQVLARQVSISNYTGLASAVTTEF